MARALKARDDALRFQAATADILASLARSRESPQPVFDAIVRNTLRLFDTRYAVVFLISGEQLELAAVQGDASFAPGSEAAQRFVKSFPQPLDWTSFTGRAMKGGEVRQLVPIVGNPEATPRAVALAKSFGYNSMAIAPLMLDGRVIGAIGTNQRTARRYSAEELVVLKAFAHQAVIAIENVRLFNETQQALERQTATADVLRVISSSPTSTQPVFDAILASATRLCDAQTGILFRYADDAFHAIATRIPDPRNAALFAKPLRPAPDSMTGLGRVRRERRAVHIPDMLNDPAYDARDPVRVESLQAGLRSWLGVPMLKDGALVGTIVIYRGEPRPFTEQQSALLQTFADQAVIAIENVRLFNELQARNKDLGESLDQQTATSEILRVISSSVADVQPVLDAIVTIAAKIFRPRSVGITMREGDKLVLRARGGALVADGQAQEIEKIFPLPFERRLDAARAIADCEIVQIADAQGADRPREGVRTAKALNYRSLAFVPLVREGVGIGAIGLVHRDPGQLLTDKELCLVKTFADQAVIAIENVRLFNETKEALERQTATGEVLRAISTSPTDTRPVFQRIAESAQRLCEAQSAYVSVIENGIVVGGGASVASERREQVMAWASKLLPMPVAKATLIRLAVEARETVYSQDVASDPRVDDWARPLHQQLGTRSVAVVPMQKDGKALGVLQLQSGRVGAFSEKHLELLKTFADQAVIAVENTRLFKELEARNRDLAESLERQTATAEILRAISRATSDVAPVFETILRSAVRLCDAQIAAAFRFDGRLVHMTATHNWSKEALDYFAKVYPSPPDPALISGRVILSRSIVKVDDAAADPHYDPTSAATGHWRRMLGVPMLREGEPLGVLIVTWREPGETPQRQVDLLQTFADQAVIAIENLRLFREIQEKSAQLEVANRHKSEFLANMSHELRTPLNAIIGFSEVLMEKMFGEVNDKQADYLKDIHESGRHLLSLINDILDLSKIEAGRMELEPSSFSLPAAISNAMTLVRERAQRHGVQLGAEVDPRLGEWHADERKVKQILLNLLSNAVRFTPEGGRVDVRAKLDGESVEISVTDTGVGISAEDQAKLFEEFRQVGADATRKAEGTGLGLALAKKFVELHGGGIRVASAPGKGATFSFSLPSAPSARSASSG